MKTISILIAFVFFFLNNIQAQDELFEHCLKCDIEGVRTAIANGSDVNKPHSTTGQSALSYSYHCPMVTKYLLEQGGDPNGGNFPALVSAASIASLEVMKMLIEKGADPNLKGGGEPPLFKIVQMTNCAECAELLLSHGADKSTKGGIYSNLFRVFASFGLPQVERKETMVKFAKVLEGYGLAMNESFYNPDATINASPFEMAKVLKKYGVDINERTKVMSSPKNDGEPPLFTAMNVGKKEVILSILEQGANYNATYPVYNPDLFLFNIKGGYTPLMYAAIQNQKWLVEKLLKFPDLTNPVTSGTFITKDKNFIDMKEMSAMYLAIMSGNIEIVKLLADSNLKWADFVLNMKGGKFEQSYGSKPNAYVFGNLKALKKSKLKYTPSLFADFSKQIEMAEYLRSKGL